MHATFQLVAVAFLRSTGGRLRVLFAVERDEAPLFDGEPALLVDHRPGRPPHELEAEVADAVASGAATVVLDSVAAELVELIDGAFDEEGSFVGERLLGQAVGFDAPDDTFDV